LGSLLAGIKAGTLSGIVYIGGIAIFNAILLVVLKAQVIDFISQTKLCTGVATTLEGCFWLVVTYDVPFLAFVSFFIALLYSGVFGIIYDRIPGGWVVKGEGIGAVVGINLVFFGYSGFYFNTESVAIGGPFFLAWTAIFGYLIGRLYKKYTRQVSFQSENKEALKVFLDNRNATGKSRTLSMTSTHKIRAEVSDDATFKEWVTSGGIAIEDHRSFETTFEVNGDGLVKGRVGKKD
jgi:hypothetical protein